MRMGRLVEMRLSCSVKLHGSLGWMEAACERSTPPPPNAPSIHQIAPHRPELRNPEVRESAGCAKAQLAKQFFLSGERQRPVEMPELDPGPCPEVHKLARKNP